jgi:hypothetical protein
MMGHRCHCPPANGYSPSYADAQGSNRLTLSLITTGSWPQTATTVAVVNKQDADVHLVRIGTLRCPDPDFQRPTAGASAANEEPLGTSITTFIYVRLRSSAFGSLCRCRRRTLRYLTSCYPEPGNRKVRGSTPPLATHMKIDYIHRSGEFTLHRDRYTFSYLAQRGARLGKERDVGHNGQRKYST